MYFRHDDTKCSATAPIPSSTSTTSSSDAPALPSKPSALNSVVNRTASNYSPYGGQSRLGASPYGGMGSVGGMGGIGGYNSYSSPYSRLGGMGSSMYGGGYGSMYGGGMGGMGMGGMYGGGMGGYGQPGMMGEDQNSLTNSFSQSTQATFQIIESVVGAFGGFAQMLESTYMATHSSFFGTLSLSFAAHLRRVYLYLKGINAFHSNDIRRRTILQPP